MSYFIKGTTTIPKGRFWEWARVYLCNHYDIPEDDAFLPQIFCDKQNLSVIHTNNTVYTIPRPDFWVFAQRYTPCAMYGNVKISQLRNVDEGIEFDFTESLSLTDKAQFQYQQASIEVLETWNEATHLEHCVKPSAWAAASEQARVKLNDIITRLLADGQQPRLYMRGPELFRANIFVGGNYWEDNKDPVNAFNKVIEDFYSQTLVTKYLS